MKKILTIIYLLLFIQVSSHASDSTATEVQLNPKKSGAAILIDFGFNNLYNVKDPYKLKFLGSRGLNVYYMYQLRLGYFFSINPGLGLGFDNYSFQNENLRLSPSNGALNAALDTTSKINYFKSRLSCTYVDAPLEIRFKSSQNNKKAFHIAVGGKIGVLINSKTKYKFEENNITIKQKQISNLYVNPVRYGLTGRIGYGLFQVFAYYSLNPLFQKNKHLEVTPIMFGVTLTSL